MALDPNISLGVQPVQMPNPLQMMGQMAQTQHAITANNALMQQLGANQAMSEALSGAINPDGSIDYGQAMLGLQGSPYAYNALPMAKQIQELKQGQLGIDTSQQALADKRRMALGSSLGSLVNEQNLTPDKVIATGAQLVRDGVIDQNTFATHLANIGDMGQDQLRGYLKQQYFSVMSPDQLRGMQTPQYQTIDDGAHRQITNINPFASDATNYHFPMQMSPAEANAPVEVADPVTGQKKMVTKAQFVAMANGNSGGVPNGPAPANQSYQTTTANNAAANEQELLNRVSNGSQLMHNLQEQQQLVATAKTGGGANWRANMAQKLQAWGFPQSAVDAAAGGNLGDAQTLQKLMVQGAVAQMKSTLSGHQTEGQMNAFLSANPNLDKDPRALDKITQFYNGIYQNDVAQQHGLNQWKQAHPGQDTSGFFQNYAVGPQQKAFSTVQQPGSKAPTVVRSGTFNGKKVIQYSDGSVRYAQ